MNKDDIINLAREYTVGGLEFDEEGLLCFVEIIAAAEREACAKVCDAYIGADPIAAAIRAMGQG